MDLRPGDVLVMHEVGGPKWSFLAGDAPVVMLCQGHTFLFDNLDPEAPVVPGYPGWPHVTSVVATSDYVRRVVVAMAGADLPVHRVPVLIDGTRFAPRPKERLIAYMPRRRSQDLQAVRHLLRRAPEVAGWSLVPIDRMSEREVADVLGRSAVFLSGAEREGFGMPGAEAMAAGCYVIGFTGDGGSEYLTDDVAGVVHDADVLAMADLVRAAAAEHDRDPSALAARARVGRDRVLAAYGPDAFAGAVVETFREIAAEGSPSVVTRATTVVHYQSHAPRGGAVAGAYVASRRLAGRARRWAAGARSTRNATSN